MHEQTRGLVRSELRPAILAIAALALIAWVMYVAMIYTAPTLNDSNRLRFALLFFGAGMLVELFLVVFKVRKVLRLASRA